MLVNMLTLTTRRTWLNSTFNFSAILPLKLLLVNLECNVEGVFKCQEGNLIATLKTLAIAEMSSILNCPCSSKNFETAI